MKNNKIHKIPFIQRLPLWLRRWLFNLVMPELFHLTDENRRLRDGIFKVLGNMPELYPYNLDKINLENVLYNTDRKPVPMPNHLDGAESWYEIRRTGKGGADEEIVDKE